MTCRIHLKVNPTKMYTFFNPLKNYSLAFLPRFMQYSSPSEVYLKFIAVITIGATEHIIFHTVQYTTDNYKMY